MKNTQKIVEARIIGGERNSSFGTKIISLGPVASEEPITTTKEARCSTLFQAAGIANALAMSFYLPVLGADIIFRTFVWVVCGPFPLSVQGRRSRKLLLRRSRIQAS